MYILPDGRKAHNMKEGCELIGISSEKFRAKVRCQEIKKVLIRSKSDNNGKDIAGI